MANLDNFRGDGQQTQPVYATTWTVIDTSTGNDDEVTCTKAAEAGKTHFITFLTASTDSTTQAAGGVVKATLSGSSSGTTLIFWPQESDGPAAPAHMDFNSPIQMAENETVTFSSDMANNDDQVTYTMGGFSNETRIE